MDEETNEEGPYIIAVKGILCLSIYNELLRRLEANRGSEATPQEKNDMFETCIAIAEEQCYELLKQCHKIVPIGNSLDNLPALVYHNGAWQWSMVQAEQLDIEEYDDGDFE